MADCLICTDNYTVEEIIRLVSICSEGKVAFRVKIVSYLEDCIDCSASYTTVEELLRNSLYCDENGLFYIQITPLSDG